MEAFDVEEIGGRRYCVAHRQPDLPWHFILLMPWILLLTELAKKAWWTGVVTFVVLIVAIAIFEARRPRKVGLAVGVTVQAGVDDLASTRGLLSVVDGQLRFEGSSFRFALGASDFERVCRNQNLELCLRVSAHGDLPTQYIVLHGSPWTVRKATQLAEDAQSGGTPLFPPFAPASTKCRARWTSGGWPFGVWPVAWSPQFSTFFWFAMRREKRSRSLVCPSFSSPCCPCFGSMPWRRTRRCSIGVGGAHEHDHASRTHLCGRRRSAAPHSVAVAARCGKRVAGPVATSNPHVD